MNNATVARPISLTEEKPTAGRSLLADALRRLVRNPLALLGIAIVLIMILAAIFAERIAPYAPIDADLNLVIARPSAQHTFGTDDVGRDIFSRIIYGARVSLSVSL